MSGVSVHAADEPAAALSLFSRTTPRRRVERTLHAYLLLLPSLLFLVPFTVWPAIRVVFSSFFQQDLPHPTPTFIGLGNFVAEFSNPIFGQVLRNTALYALGTVPISVGLALLLAIEVNKRLRLSGAFRTALFYPTILPTVGAASVWLFVYTPSFGLLDRLLSLFGVGNHNWLGDPGLVLPALMLIAIWKQTGYFMVFYLAGLQSLPTAALVNAFQTVDQLFILTQGGPNNSSSLLLYWLYIEGFHNFNVGRASAVTVVMIAVVLGISMLNLRFQDRQAHYES